VVGVLLLALASVAPAVAQITAAGTVVNGHHHFNAGDVAEHQRFWVEALGGRAGTFANGAPIAIFPNALIFMRDQHPMGGMIGSTLNHVAFSVPNLRAAVDRIAAAGFKMTTTSEAPAGVRVIDDIGVIEGTGPVSGIAYVEGPDGIKIEVLEMRAQTESIASHHIHFFGENPTEMRAWYIEHFDFDAVGALRIGDAADGAGAVDHADVVDDAHTGRRFARRDHLEARSLDAVDGRA
jgi:catechol 2,3-dioxygenase-like lactoylglutathione lyase family enzyme